MNTLEFSPVSFCFRGVFPVLIPKPWLRFREFLIEQIFLVYPLFWGSIHPFELSAWRFIRRQRVSGNRSVFLLRAL